MLNRYIPLLEQREPLRKTGLLGQRVKKKKKVSILCIVLLCMFSQVVPYLFKKEEPLPRA